MHDEDTPAPEESESAEPCGDCMSAVAEHGAKHDCDGSEDGACGCPACAAEEAVAAQDGFTYSFISRGSYGYTTANFTAPSCVANALVAGSAAPAITVYGSGTYRVRRSDGTVQTATCTRLAAGKAATTAHENSHANGARNAVTAANNAAGLPRNFATQSDCSAAAGAIVSTWNASVNAAWANEVAHGPGTNPPTAQTFTEENAAGNCTFA